MAFPLLLPVSSLPQAPRETRDEASRAPPGLVAPEGTQQLDPDKIPAVPAAPSRDRRLDDTLLGMVVIVALALWMSGHGPAAGLPLLFVVLVGMRLSAGSGGGGGGGGCGGGGCGC